LGEDLAEAGVGVVAEHPHHPLLNHGTWAMLAAISGSWTGRL
jgi:hypothetical protein